jgi:hypothetical protein
MKSIKSLLLIFGMLILAMLLFSCSSDSESGCPQGFTGNNCSTQITPSKILITKIVVKSFPNLKPNNSYWDDIPNEYADIFPVISTMSGDVVYFSNVYYNNAFGSNLTPYTFNLTPNIEITNFQQNYVLGIWDFDGNNSNPELMSSISFSIYSQTGGFPPKITISQPANGFEAEVYLTYKW